MVQKPVKTLRSSDSWILKGSGFCDLDSSRLEKVTQAFPNAWIYNEFLMVPFGTKSIKINKNMFKSIFGEQILLTVSLSKFSVVLVFFPVPEPRESWKGWFDFLSLLKSLRLATDSSEPTAVPILESWPHER